MGTRKRCVSLTVASVFKLGESLDFILQHRRESPDMNVMVVSNRSRVWPLEIDLISGIAKVDR